MDNTFLCGYNCDKYFLLTECYKVCSCNNIVLAKGSTPVEDRCMPKEDHRGRVECRRRQSSGVVGAVWERGTK